MHVRDSNPKDKCTQFAYASGCDYDPITLRPTVGQMTICPKLFSQTEGEIKATLHHEVLHALVGTGLVVTPWLQRCNVT